MLKRLVVGTGIAVAAVAVAGVMSRAAVAAQDKPCLHAVGESAEQAARRTQALAFTRHVNTQQAASFPTKKAYSSAADLTLTRSAPDGFEFKLTADGVSYSFSVVDRTDPCLFGFFSNDSGLIYHGQVIQ